MSQQPEVPVTPEVPIRLAATVMLLDERPQLQVLMLERHVANVFASGMWVFPGGAVDPDDADHLSRDQGAIELPGVAGDASAFYIAAIREAFEEAGVLLARHAGATDHIGLHLDAATETRFADHRQRLNDRTLRFVDVLDAEQLIPCIDDMHYAARWITPPGPPRRFDTRFFVARMPTDQTPLHDDREMVNSVWLSPQEILEQEAAGEMAMMTPTSTMLRLLACHESADAVMQALQEHPADERVRVRESDRRIVVPGESGYATASETIEFGWVRLRGC